MMYDEYGEIITGGPAYPAKASTGIFLGMTLRDYFAAKAMQACIARGDDSNRPGIAEWSYAMADTMLKERIKEQ